MGPHERDGLPVEGPARRPRHEPIPRSVDEGGSDRHRLGEPLREALRLARELHGDAHRRIGAALGGVGQPPRFAQEPTVQRDADRPCSTGCGRPESEGSFVRMENKPKRDSQLLAVIESENLGESLHRVKLGWPASPEPLRSFRAGQFAELALPGLVLPRPFSILAADDEGLEFLVQAVGPGSDAIAGLPLGASLRCTWPLGRGFADAIGDDWPQGRDWLLVGGGVGVAPLIAAAREIEASEARQRPFFGWRGRAHAEAGARLHPDLDVAISTDDGSLGQPGHVHLALEAWLQAGGAAAWRRPALLACGPEPMMAAVSALARRHGLDCWLSLETYMGCGIGICVGCAVAVKGPRPWKLACQDGPVFSTDELREDL